jgi:hypothetical protein
MSNIYISHSTNDKEFTDKLRLALAKKGHEILTSTEEDAFTKAGTGSDPIGNSDILVCIMSPSFLSSAACLKEVMNALTQNKSIVKVN